MEGTIWTVIGTLVTIGTFMRRRGVKPTGKSHSYADNISSLPDKKKTKRPTEKGCPSPTDEPNCYISLRFFDVVLRHFFLWLSLTPVMWRLTELHVFTFFLRCFYVFVLGKFRSQGSEAWLNMHKDRLLRPKQVETCVQSVVRAQWVMKPCLPFATLGTNPSEAGSPQSNQTCWPQSMSATKKRSLPEDRSSTKAWNPEKHCFWKNGLQFKKKIGWIKLGIQCYEQ